MKNRKLVLENKVVFEGIGFGCLDEVVAEIIYNTSVVGYQEIISDPTNTNKIICMTYPLIGNYGLTDEDYESKYLKVKGLIVREYNEIPSNFRYTRTLEDVMEENNICGICGVDTRSIMKIIRDNGSLKGLICDIDKPIEECMEVLNNYVEEERLVQQVSSKRIWYSRTPNSLYNVAVIDLGVKNSYIKELNKLGCNVIVFPYNTTKEEILKYKPNGLFISNGPGNPEFLNEVVEVINSFKGIVPVFGINLGYHLIGKTYGIETYKLKTGHHGLNYPVKNLETGKIEITAQNYLYALNKEQIEASNLKVTHQNVIDNDYVGFYDEENNVFAVEFDSIPQIDEDSENVFKTFINLIKNYGGKNNA